jgi:ketosteroid isomerase-like protein
VAVTFPTKKTMTRFSAFGFLSLLTAVIAVALAARPVASYDSSKPADDKAVLVALDAEYQAAVKTNDVATMDRILADDFVLVTGSGKTYSKQDLINESRSGTFVYEHQEDTDRAVRVWGDTAVVTAKLWEKGTNAGKAFDYTVWFSDVYIRTPQGWRYIFGQSSLPPAKAP